MVKLKSQRRWRKKNIDKVRQYQREYYAKNKEKILKQNKESYLRNIEKRKKYEKAYYIKTINERKEYLTKYGIEYRKTDKDRYRQLKYNAKLRGLILDISFEEWKEIVKNPCHYCKGETTGLDRVDNEKGYLKNNVVPCCKRCNAMKEKLSVEEFINQCIKIIKNYNGQKQST